MGASARWRISGDLSGNKGPKPYPGPAAAQRWYKRYPVIIMETETGNIFVEGQDGRILCHAYTIATHSIKAWYCIAVRSCNSGDAASIRPAAKLGSHPSHPSKAPTNLSMASGTISRVRHTPTHPTI